MQVCFLTASMIGGGTERVVAVLANYFAKQGHKVSILLTADNRVDYKLDSEIELIQISRATGGSLSGRMQRLQTLRKYFKQHKEVAYLSFGTETNMFAILASLGLKRKLVLSERNDPHQCGFQMLRRIIYFFGRTFVFQTQEAREFFSARIQKRGMVIPNPVSEKLPAQYTGERRKVIAAVGRLDANKNHEMLIKAFAQFYKEYSDYQLHIYGKGELREHLQSVIDEYGLQEAALLQGFCDNVLETVKDCAMYVLCSNSEGLSNSLMEAMAIGIPSIATDCPIGGSRMLIKNYKNGILIPVGDMMALVTAMKELADKPQLAQSIAFEAKKLQEEYSVEKVAAMWLKAVSGM